MTTPRTAETGDTASPSARLIIDVELGATTANDALNSRSAPLRAAAPAAIRRDQTIREL
jgi:hypothetical protein